MNFGFAIEYLKTGGTVTRRSWFDERVLKMAATSTHTGDRLFTTTPIRNRVARWVINHDDVLAEDWIAVHK